MLPTMSRRLLLLSSSVVHGTGFLDWCADDLRAFLSGSKTVLFVPYARPSGISHDEYTRVVRDRFSQMEINVTGIQDFGNTQKAVETAEALFVGGGNTFVLLHDLYQANVLPVIRDRVRQGMPYIGSSAGTNIAGLTIGTSNDMPIVHPPSFDALGLVPFNINPHYLDPDPSSTHKGESRETRIREFHCFNSQPVIGLREGSYFQVEGDAMRLGGDKPCRLFRAGQEPVEVSEGSDLRFILSLKF